MDKERCHPYLTTPDLTTQGFQIWHGSRLELSGFDVHGEVFPPFSQQANKMIFLWHSNMDMVR